jgi:hypothetical protein
MKNIFSNALQVWTLSSSCLCICFLHTNTRGPNVASILTKASLFSQSFWKKLNKSRDIPVVYNNSKSYGIHVKASENQVT